MSIETKVRSSVRTKVNSPFGVVILIIGGMITVGADIAFESSRALVAKVSGSDSPSGPKYMVAVCCRKTCGHGLESQRLGDL